MKHGLIQKVCLGPPASFSEDALVAACGRFGLERFGKIASGCHFVDKNEDVLREFVSRSGKAIASLAVHTLAEGRLSSSFKGLAGLLDKREEVQILGAVDVPISFCLLARPGVTHIKGIIGHARAAGACRAFTGPVNVPVVTTSSNSEAARLVADSEGYAQYGALASERCARVYNLNILHTACEDSPARTIFYILGKGFELPDELLTEWRAFLVFDLENASGAIHRATAPMAEAKVNMPTFYPLYLQKGRYRYCAELEGDGCVASAKGAIRRMESYVETMVSFGPFPFVRI